MDPFTGAALGIGKYLLAYTGITGASIYAYKATKKKKKSGNIFLDKCKHTRVIGLPGMGKTEKLIAEALWLARQGKGFIWIDVHNKSARELMQALISEPDEIRDKVVYMNPIGDRVVGVNPLVGYSGGIADLTTMADDMAALYEDIFGARYWGDRIEDNIRYSVQAIVEYAHKTPGFKPIIFDPYRLMNDKEFMGEVLSKIENQVVLDHWSKYKFKDKDSKTTNSKLKRPLSSEYVLEFLGQEDGLDMKKAINSGKIVIVDIPRLVGEKNQKLMAGLIVAKFLQAVYTRGLNKDFYYAFLDEFQSYVKFTGDAVEQLIAECRKFNVGLYLAHQYLGQLDKRKDVQEAAEACQTQWIFRLKRDDAKTFAEMLNDDYKNHKDSTFGWLFSNIFTPRRLQNMAAFHYVEATVEGSALVTPKVVKTKLVEKADRNLLDDFIRHTTRMGLSRREIKFQLQKRLEVNVLEENRDNVEIIERKEILDDFSGQRLGTTPVSSETQIFIY